MSRKRGKAQLEGGAWLALIAAVTIGVYNLLAWWWPLWLPGDGWVYADLVPREGEVRVVTDRYLTPELPTALRPGDEVLSIAGVPVETIVARALNFAWQAPPGWEAGGEVVYQVLREGQVLDLRVPIHHLPAATPLRYAWPSWQRAAPELSIAAAVLVIGCLVFAKRPNESGARALLVFSVALATGLINLPITGAAFFGPELLLAIALSPWQFAIIPSIVYFMLVFPVPKAMLRRYGTWVKLALYFLAQVLLLLCLGLNWGQAAATLSAIYTVYGVQAGLLALIIIASTVHSWLTVREPVARAQLRWIALGVLAGFVLGALAWIVATLFFRFSGLFLVISELTFLILPLCLGVAVLRYRLFDIDRLINRALVYGSLTAVLALAYLGLVVVLQGLLGWATGQQQAELVTVLSTLTIAALFSPARQRLQRFIDRRFYRTRYDAGKTLAMFGTGLRDEVDLHALERRLMAVVDETMQPEHVRLWRRET